VALVNYALYHEAQPKAKPAKGQSSSAQGEPSSNGQRPAATENGTSRPVRSGRQQYDSAASLLFYLFYLAGR
jgi:hypothetical protein